MTTGNAQPGCANQPPLDMLAVAGDESDLIEGSHATTDADTFANQGTQSWHPDLRGGFGTDSRCGLDGDIVKVTNLDDSGPGSLRAAIEASGPRIIVFEVSGGIHLESALFVREPHVTIAGQTAPAPGVAIYNEHVRIQTHDVCVQHLRFRIGDRHADGSVVSSEIAGNRDGIVVRGGQEPGGTHHVVFDNVSMSWGLDETLTLREGVTDITVRDSIIAESLNDSPHPTPQHSYCFFALDTTRASVIGNVFAHCRRRHPRADGGAWMYVNNFVYNPGDYAVHGHRAADYSVVGNVLAFPSDTGAWVNGGADELLANRHDDIRAYFVGNEIPSDRDLHGFAGPATGPLAEVSAARVWLGDVKAVPAASVESVLMDHVGAFPQHRDAVDARVIADARAREGGYVGSQQDVGGYPSLQENTRALSPPADLRGDDDGDGIDNVVEWLQEFVCAIE